MRITCWRHKGWTKDKQKEDKGISFPNLCAHILLEAQTLCANNPFPKQIAKIKEHMEVNHLENPHSSDPDDNNLLNIKVCYFSSKFFVIIFMDFWWSYYHKIPSWLPSGQRAYC